VRERVVSFVQPQRKQLQLRSMIDACDDCLQTNLTINYPFHLFSVPPSAFLSSLVPFHDYCRLRMSPALPVFNFAATVWRFFRFRFFVREKPVPGSAQR